jgi:hypothetical protein
MHPPLGSQVATSSRGSPVATGWIVQVGIAPLSSSMDEVCVLARQVSVVEQSMLGA